MKTIRIHGSHGTLRADAESGMVVACNHTGESLDYATITQIDLDELRRAYPCEAITSADILDVGYWLRDGTYEPPDSTFREHIKNSLQDDAPSDIARITADLQFLRDTRALGPHICAHINKEGQSV